VKPSHHLAWRVLHAIARKPTEPFSDEAYEAGFASDERFLARLPLDLSFTGRSVLDYGCGYGQMCVTAARRGARRVLGVEIQPVDGARARVRERFPELQDRIRLKRITSPRDLGEEKFDLIISKNTFEHVADPDGYVAGMVDHLAEGGEIVIGFAPPWKAPHGGHMWYMTRVPWAHLIFPEDVILKERKRYRPDENPARLEDVRGGLNKMTVARFREVMTSSGLEARYFAINRHEHPVVKVADVLRRVPGLEEYFTLSVHTVWRRGAERAASQMQADAPAAAGKPPVRYPSSERSGRERLKAGF
jgi:SAM-dependent methyltransferase